MGLASGPAFGRLSWLCGGVGAPASALGAGILPGVALYPPPAPCSMGFRFVFRCGIVAALRSPVAVLCVRVCVRALVWVLTF